MNLNNNFTKRSLIFIFIAILTSIILPYLLFDKHVIYYQVGLAIGSLLIIRFSILKILDKEFKEISKDLETFYSALDNNDELYKLKESDFDSVFSLKDAMSKFLDSFKRIVSYQGGVITDYSQMQQELEYNNKAKEAMINLTSQLIDLETEDKLYSLILEESIGLIGASVKGSFLTHDKHGNLFFKALSGYEVENYESISIKLNESFLWIASHGKISTPIAINGLREFNEQHMSDKSFALLDQHDLFQAKSVLSCPIIINDEFYGMINLDSDVENAFSINDVKVMSYFISQIGIAIKNHELFQKIVQLSRFDKLTQVYNRSYFEELFQDYTKRTMRYREKFALVLCDLNHLKKINDSFGHAAGDLALKTFVSLLKENIRETDYIARIGGDEFVIILHENNYDQALDKMSGLQETINRENILYNNAKIPIRFSYGIATSPDESMIYDILSKIADDRMYENKRAMKEKYPTLMG